MKNWIKILVSIDTVSGTPEGDIRDIFTLGADANSYSIDDIDCKESLSDLGFHMEKE